MCTSEDVTDSDLFNALRGSTNASVVSLLFPFSSFFPYDGYTHTHTHTQGENKVFTGDYDEDMRVGEGCLSFLIKSFEEIEECRAFELLTNQRERAEFLLTNMAKVVAMTCTHAALQRGNLVNMKFRYDSLIMEEAAQILEVESFIPMLLQTSDEGVSRLKRVVLIGDHHQLPPIVKNRALQRYGRLDQSMYARYIRLGIPSYTLDTQGRARPSLVSLYGWRYERLLSLPAVTRGPFVLGCAGFLSPYQFVNVPDYEGKGESTPRPHYFINKGEAEFAVAMFMYMRLIGYPASRISLLTSYNGQKDMINDIIAQRCAWHPLFGTPADVETVDRFQGQQNDYIIVSLVRTRHVGHIRDVRRLVVAMSRARLGLWILGRYELFNKCDELQPVMSQLRKLPTSLALLTHEVFPTTRKERDSGPYAPLLVPDVQHIWGVLERKGEERLKSLPAGSCFEQQLLDVSTQPQPSLPHTHTHTHAYTTNTHTSTTHAPQTLQILPPPPQHW
eukprot:GHVR01016613.1.p1 GENE.GHVR01016613.1~~GHVR01016613.1.p1  ORF type:complete len:566 (+),score=185.57 GHVR01016613.1:191-1699(+)